jgi:spore germination protein GerM
MVAVCCLLGMRMLYHSDTNLVEPLQPAENPVQEEPQQPVEKPKTYVNVFFIGQNANKEEVYKAVNRAYDEEVDGSKIKFAIQALITGPKMDEQAKGVYSEIPSSTRIISINETSAEVIINLSADFENGGGTESLYKRLYQLIKTAKRNTTKPVYLYIDGRKADVIGGEGIMITQPLNDNSLDG